MSSVGFSRAVERGPQDREKGERKLKERVHQEGVWPLAEHDDTFGGGGACRQAERPVFPFYTCFGGSFRQGYVGKGWERKEMSL